MSLRISRVRLLLAFSCAAAIFALTPSLASAAAQTFSITPCNSSCTPDSPSFVAGASDSATLSSTLDTSKGTPTSVKIELAPGALANLTANKACLASTSYTTACFVGSGSATLNVPPGSETFNAYLVPPTNVKADVAGLDLVLSGQSSAAAHAELSVHQLTSGPAAGQVVADMTFDLSSNPIAPFVTGISANLNGDLNGKPFTRMPTSCALRAPSSLTVVYTGGTETTSASSDVNVSSTCALLAYAPKVLGAATVTNKLPSGAYAVKVTTVVTQAAGQAANSSSVLTAPSILSANVQGAEADFGKQVGTAAAISPLVPKELKGVAILTGSITAPVLSVQFPAPYAFSLKGQLNAFNNTFTFTHLPDIPIADLVVTLAGGKNSLLETSCASNSGQLKGGFVAQNGKTAKSAAKLNITGCPAGPPTVSGGSVTGLSTGKPVLKFTLNKGKNAPNIKSFKVGLPTGLSLNASKLKSGVTVTGGGKFSVSGGKLVVKLNKAESTVAVKIATPALVESKTLQKNVKNHKVKQLTFSIAITDAAGHTTTLPLKLKTS